jgi:hypothetical protein
LGGISLFHLWEGALAFFCFCFSHHTSIILELVLTLTFCSVFLFPLQEKERALNLGYPHSSYSIYHPLPVLCSYHYCSFCGSHTTTTVISFACCCLCVLARLWICDLLTTLHCFEYVICWMKFLFLPYSG